MKTGRQNTGKVAGGRNDIDQVSRLGPSFGVGLLQRFLLLYPVVFMLPFPLTLLSLLDIIPSFSDSFLASTRDGIMGLHGWVTQPLIALLGRMIAGEDPSFEFTGSGDGLASYLGVLLDIILSVILATAWWLWRGKTPISPRTSDVCQVLVRYFLAWVMLSYGFSKVFPLQFSEMGPDRLLQPYGDSSPMGLLWTFMGASTGYQMFAGAAEVVGALMLLFRRTTLLGALVIAAVMTNVFAMNVFFDVPVKLYSFHYLLFAVLLTIPDVPRLFGLFVANAPVASRDLRPFWYSSKRWYLVLGAVKVVFIAAMLWMNFDSRIDRMYTHGPWSEKSELQGIYQVESFDLEHSDGGSSVPSNIGWIRVGLNPPRSAAVQFADGTVKRLRMKIDEEASSLALFDRSLLEPPADPLELELLDESRIQISGIFEGKFIVVRLRRLEVTSLFESRRFRWITEVPFNR